MKVALVGGGFVAEGSYQECSAWAYSMIMLERNHEAEMQKRDAKKETEKMNELLNTPFIELVRRENEEEQSHE